MPDMERSFRSLALHMAKTPEQKAYLSGRHAGLDRARLQIAVLAAVAAVVIVGISAHV